MNQDQEHLNLLSIFHYVVGGLTMLASCIFLVYVAMGILMITGTLDHSKDAPPPAIGWVFSSIGVVAILIGWTIGILTIIAGRKLRARRSRVFCIVVAAIQCLNQPLGTVLGIFTIIVLLRPSVASLFDTGGQINSPPMPTQY